jgi:hypothetical protein
VTSAMTSPLSGAAAAHPANIKPRLSIAVLVIAFFMGHITWEVASSCGLNRPNEIGRFRMSNVRFRAADALRLLDLHPVAVMQLGKVADGEPVTRRQA